MTPLFSTAFRKAFPFKIIFVDSCSQFSKSKVNVFVSPPLHAIETTCSFKPLTEGVIFSPLIDTDELHCSWHISELLLQTEDMVTRTEMNNINHLDDLIGKQVFMTGESTVTCVATLN